MSADGIQGNQTSTAKVQQALRDRGVAATVVEMPASTRTAKEAAQAVGCEVGQIAKSLVFRGASGKPYLVIASGANRVNEAVMSRNIGEPIERATPDFVRETTGYAIGGVPPLGHQQPMAVWLDRDLMAYDRIWAAAGTPFAVFEIIPADLERAAGAIVVDVK